MRRIEILRYFGPLWTAIFLVSVACEASAEKVRIGTRYFPDEFCSGDQIAQMLDSLVTLQNLPFGTAAHLTRFLPDICRLNYLFTERISTVKNDSDWSSDWHQDSQGLLGVYAQHADMRQYCMLTPKSGEYLPRDYLDVWNRRPSEINCRDEADTKIRAWEHLRLYKVQTCVLMYLMCIVCYAYGRLMALKLSPSVRLRRLNWTKENFIWAYKNF